MIITYFNQVFKLTKMAVAIEVVVCQDEEVLVLGVPHMMWLEQRSTAEGRWRKLKCDLLSSEENQLNYTPVFWGATCRICHKAEEICPDELYTHN